MIRAIVFDLDNTLIDFIKMKTISCEEAVSAMIGAGLDVKKKAALRKIFEIYSEIGMESREIFQRYLKEELGRIDYRILGSGIAAYRRVHTSFYEPYPHVIPTLLELKQRGIRFAILSDAPRLKAWIRLCSIKVEPFIDEVVTFDDTKRFKPHKKPFQVVLRRLGVHAGECLMVGDNYRRDILGAMGAGMKTCFAKYGSTKFEKMKWKKRPDYIIHDIKGLLRIVPG